MHKMRLLTGGAHDAPQPLVGCGGDTSPRTLPTKEKNGIYRFYEKRSLAIKYAENVFATGASPQTTLGSSRCSPRPRPPDQLQRGHRSPDPTPLDASGIRICPYT